MNILWLGDIVGIAARDALCRRIWSLRRELGASFVIANAENTCMGSGNGLDRESAQLLLQSGIDVLTGGNHIFAKQNLYSFLDDTDAILRPGNYAAASPGHGSVILSADGVRILTMDVSGRVYMDACDDPFVCVEHMLRAQEGQYDLALLEVHAEATAEKAALARAFDGRLCACVGTHTHVQTNDARLLPRGTAFLTDLGMCGPTDSVLGVRSACIVQKLTSGMPTRFELADGPLALQGALLRVDGNGRATSIETVNLPLSV